MSRTPQSTRSDWPLLLPVLTLMGGWLLHQSAGLSLPLAVVDEACFFYPAQAFADKATLIAPNLNPTRELFWMPPGYMMLLGTWMWAIYDNGLESARLLSFLLSCGAYLVWVRLFRKWGLGLPGLVLLSLAFLSRHWVVMGNMVRMEGLELLLWGLGLLLMQKGNRWAALSWFLLSVVVHPNGLFFCFYWLTSPPYPPFHISRVGHYWKGLWHALPGLIGVSAYIVYILPHWPEFVHDWRFQFSTKAPGGMTSLLFRPESLLFLLILAGCAYWLYRTQERKALWAALNTAFVLWLIRTLGQGWTYGIFNVLAITLTGAVTIVLLQDWAEKRPASSWKPYLPIGSSILLILALVAGKVYSIPGLWQTYEWHGMAPVASLSQSYLTKSDRGTLHNGLMDVARDVYNRQHRPLNLYTVPEAEGILLGYTTMVPPDRLPWCQHVLPIVPIAGNPVPDYILWHREPFEAIYQSSKADLAPIVDTDTLTPFYQRMSADGQPEATWYLVPLHGRLPPFILRAFTEPGDSVPTYLPHPYLDEAR